MEIWDSLDEFKSEYSESSFLDFIKADLFFFLFSKILGSINELPASSATKFLFSNLNFFFYFFSIISKSLWSETVFDYYLKKLHHHLNLFLKHDRHLHPMSYIWHLVFFFLIFLSIKEARLLLANYFFFIVIKAI